MKVHRAGFVKSLLAAAASIALVPHISSAATSYDGGTKVGTITTTLITEDSGLAVSRVNSNVLWTHNDSGDSARIFALSTTASLLGTFNLTGATNVDYEDIAVGPGPTSGVSYVYVGDIGDNNSDRASIDIYRFPEPTVTVGGPPGTTNVNDVDKITLAYPDGAHDAETLMVDPLSADIYVLTKAKTQGRLYRVSAPQSLSSTTTMTYLENIPIDHATAGDISADGSKIIVRDGADAYEWTRGVNQTIAAAMSETPQTIPLQSEPQGEAIAYSTSPAGFYTTSEGTLQPLYFYAVVPEPNVLGVFVAALLLAGRRGVVA